MRIIESESSLGFVYLSTFKSSQPGRRVWPARQDRAGQSPLLLWTETALATEQPAEVHWVKNHEDLILSPVPFIVSPNPEGKNGAKGLTAILPGIKANII